jgi:hypothetical protein
VVGTDGDGGMVVRKQTTQLGVHIAPPGGTGTRPKINKGHNAAVTSINPGRDAIDAALGRLYPGVPAHHVVLAPATAGGLHGCSAYRSEDHWHLVTYGLTELGGKSEDDDPDWSGWGFELTMQVPADEPGPPEWAFALLSETAAHVNTQGVLLEAGDRVTVSGGAVTVARDPLLGEIRTPNGKVVFLRVQR